MLIQLKRYFRAILFLLLAFSSVHAWPDGPIRERLRELREARQATTADSQSLKAGDYTFQLAHENQTRHYMVHVPKRYNPQQATPLVLSLHGGGGNMRYQATEEYYHLISKSEQAGFIAVFPNGYSRLRSGKLATWNAGICCGKARDTQSDDVGFIKRVVAEMKTKANIDPKRVYANGMSNGGMMSYRLACELSDTFSAIAAVAGTDGAQQCTPGRPVSILHIHALDDDRVLFHGGSGVKSQTHADFVSVPETIQKWVSLNACNPTPQRVLEVKGAYCELYQGCQQYSQVKLCVTDTGGHAWPGGSKVRGGAGTTAINANNLIWDFYQQNARN